MAQTSNEVKFSIYRADGSKPPSLKRSFIVKQRISLSDVVEGSLMLDDGTVWALIIEPEAFEVMLKDQSAFCIVSYQVHTHGNYAVARLYKPRGD